MPKQRKSKDLTKIASKNTKNLLGSLPVVRITSKKIPLIEISEAAESLSEDTDYSKAKLTDEKMK